MRSPARRRARFTGGAALLLASCAGGDAGPASRVGDPVPDYAAATMAGEPFHLGDGTPTLVNVWATWCAPCRKEMPELETLHRRYAARGLRIVGVSVDVRGAEERVRQFVEEVGVTFPIVHDPAERIGSVVLVMGMPTTFLVGRDGRVAWFHLGALTTETPGLVPAIEAQLEAAAAYSSRSR
jgi:cytochrome c biogenesis protein CcmG, thiol:disulfide interchange protein DsbE